MAPRTRPRDKPVAPTGEPSARANAPTESTAASKNSRQSRSKSSRSNSQRLSARPTYDEKTAPPPSSQAKKRQAAESNAKPASKRRKVQKKNEGAEDTEDNSDDPSRQNRSIEPQDTGRNPQRRASGAAGSGDARHAHVGEKYSPGDSQKDYELSQPEPSRDQENCFHFDDHPDFIPNLSPEEILRQGSFCGGYFRPIKSKKTNRAYKNDWKDLPKEWYSGLDVSNYLTHRDPPLPSLNRWKTKVGQTYEAWEDAGWIEAEHDCRGWFQWYCRFFRGRRCSDDERQIGRWTRIAAQASGRWRRIFYGKYHKAGANEVEFNEETISKGIRQTLNHWAYEPNTDHLMRYLEEKGEDVANHDDDLAQ